MSFIIKNSTLADIDEIFNFYSIASKYQKSKKTVVVWPAFDRDFVENEIRENRQFKLIVNQQIVCIWAITHSDPDIWEERNKDAALYIHRIATHPDFRGNNYVTDIVTWATASIKKEKKRFIRLDTVGNNIGLINYYQNVGFNYLGQFHLKNTDNLYGHYKTDAVCLFEIDVYKTI